jgi:hypothetical protein
MRLETLCTLTCIEMERVLEDEIVLLRNLNYYCRFKIYYLTLNIEAEHSSDMLVNSYQTTYVTSQKQ